MSVCVCLCAHVCVVCMYAYVCMVVKKRIPGFLQRLSGVFLSLFCCIFLLCCCHSSGNFGACSHAQHTHTHTHTHTHIHTHTHTYIHTYLNGSLMYSTIDGSRREHSDLRAKPRTMGSCCVCGCVDTCVCMGEWVGGDGRACVHAVRT